MIKPTGEPLRFFLISAKRSCAQAHQWPLVLISISGETEPLQEFRIGWCYCCVRFINNYTPRLSEPIVIRISKTSIEFLDCCDNDVVTDQWCSTIRTPKSADVQKPFWA